MQTLELNSRILLCENARMAHPLVQGVRPLKNYINLRHNNIRNLQEANWPIQGSSHLHPTQIIHVGIQLSLKTINCTWVDDTVADGRLFHILTTLFPNQCFPKSFLNLNLSSLKPLIALCLKNRPFLILPPMNCIHSSRSLFGERQRTSNICWWPASPDTYLQHHRS